MPPRDATTPGPEAVWSVGAIARRLDLPTSTLRTWERRYELGPSGRSAGGHRRYDAGDLERLTLMHRLVTQGVPASDAASVVRRGSASATQAAASDRLLGPSSPDPLPEAVLDAARAYDVVTLRRLFVDCLAAHGVAEAWMAHIVPTLRRVGEEWATGGIGVEGEHLASDCLLAALRAHVHSRPVSTGHGSLLLASAEDDQHSLPLLALQAAMADDGYACHVLGPRTPATALAGMIAQLDPAAVFLWASMARRGRDPLTKVLDAATGSTTVLLGGPGWTGVPPTGATVCHDLHDAVCHLREAAAVGIG